MSTIYLAGPINGCTDEEALDWREDLTIRLKGHTIISPMARDYRGKEDENVEGIVEGDKADIISSHLIVAYCPKPSVGTSMEILFAWQRNKHVVILAPKGTSISPWLRYHSDGVYSEPDQVVEHISQVTCIAPKTRFDPVMYKI